MADQRRIIRQWREGGAEALVTLAHAEGSSYRRPGAHLLVGAEGDYAGTISGGCLEAEIVRKAAWMVRSGAVMQRYSTIFDDTAEIPYGLGCGGVVELLLEPAQTPECRAWLEAMERSLSGVESRVATWLPEGERRLARAVFSAEGSVIFASESLDAAEIAEAKADCGAEGILSGVARVYLETLSAPQRLMVLGAGDDAKPIVTMAVLLGWRVTVADGRARLAKPERFAEAERVTVIESAAELGLTAADAVILMTHSYEQDRALLCDLLGGSEVPGYIGMLGAAHRSSLLVSEVASMLGASMAECCQRVWAPVGLDIGGGGDGAEAIALASIAEVQAWRQGKLDVSRRLTAERVAEQLAQSGGASSYLRAQCGLGTAR